MTEPIHNFQKPTHMTTVDAEGNAILEPLPPDIKEGMGKVIDELNAIIPLDPTAEVYHCSPTMGCGRPITRAEMIKWDRDTLREYNRLRWCDKCQNSFFTDDAEDEEDIEPTIMHCICDSADVGIGVIYELNPNCPFHGKNGA